MAGCFPAPLARSIGLQQRYQAAFGVKRHQVIAAPNMGLANEDLRHGSATCDGHHVLTRFWLRVDPDFLNLGHAFGLQNLLGANAIRANGRGVHLHV